MTTWTKEDEAQLEALQERKRQARRPVEQIAEEIYFHNIFASEIASGMIGRADRLVEALKPFCKDHKNAD